MANEGLSLRSLASGFGAHIGSVSGGGGDRGVGVQQKACMFLILGCVGLQGSGFPKP